MRYYGVRLSVFVITSGKLQKSPALDTLKINRSYIGLDWPSNLNSVEYCELLIKKAKIVFK